MIQVTSLNKTKRFIYQRYSKKMINLARNIFKQFGIQIKRYPDIDIERRMKIIKHFEIDTIIDVGANAGYYAKEMRQLGFKGKIISFEPLQSAYEGLLENSKNDPLWTSHHCALGNECVSSKINISENSWSSSIKNILSNHIEAAPTSKIIAQEDIEIKTLDSVFHSICPTESNIMLKIDVQGYEKNVLEGSLSSLDLIKLIQLEMSLTPLYDNEVPFQDMVPYLEDKGYQLYSLENGFFNTKTGQLLQVDGIFAKCN